jgi:hypothetical protein
MSSHSTENRCIAQKDEAVSVFNMAGLIEFRLEIDLIVTMIGIAVTLLFGMIMR